VTGMSSSSLLTGGLRLLAVAIVALSVGACAQKQVQDGMGAGAGAATPGSAQDFAVNVGDRVLFLTDQTSLTGQARETLNRQAQWLQLYPNTSVIIEGHADERGTREYNLGLSARRATVVRDYLVSRGI